MVEVGDKILVSVEAEVKKVGYGHGVCYLVVLPKSDFTVSRELWVNPDEVEETETDF